MSELARNIILFSAVVGTFLMGYFLMADIGKIIDGLDRKNDSDLEYFEPECVFLTGNVTDEEALREIREFRKKHSKVKVVLMNGEEEKPDKVA